MAFLQDPTTPANLMAVDASRKAARFSPQPVQATGHFSASARSGLITLIAAGTATAGHLWAIRNGNSSITVVIQRIRAIWRTVAGFTAAQEIGMAVYRMTTYTANHTGGTLISPSTPAYQRRTAFPSGSITQGHRIATTTELTAGTQVIDTQPLMIDGYAELATAATVPKGSIVMERVYRPHEYPLVLAVDEGLLLRNEVAMTGGGTARVAVELDWFELANADYGV